MREAWREEKVGHSLAKKLVHGLKWGNPREEGRREDGENHKIREKGVLYQG